MMIKTQRALCTICLNLVIAVFLSSYVPAQAPYQNLTFPPLTFTPPEIERHTLENGMKIFLVEDHEFPTVSIYALVRTGQIYEPKEKTGLATLLAEVMRTGGTTTRSPEDVSETLDFLAASVDVDINDESGSVELWTLKKNLATSLGLFADIMRNPAFAPKKFELAKKQLFEVIRRRNDSAQSIRGREFMRVVYGRQHPLARIPQVETVQNITRDDLIAFHHRYFHPNTTMLAVTGDFEPDEMLTHLEQVFQDWQPAEDVTFPEVETVSYAWNPSVHLIQKDLEQTNLALGHLGITADNPDYPAIKILDMILGAGGFSDRLSQKVRVQRGLAYSIGSYLGAGIRDSGVFMIYCATRNSTVRETIEVILEEIESLTTTPVSDRELEAAKNQYLNSFVFKFSTVEKTVHRKMFYEFIGYPPDYLEQFRDAVMNVTQADVLRVAQKYLHPDLMKILAVGNREVIREQLTAFGPVQDYELEPVE